MSNEIPLLMPKMSMTMTEGELATWRKSVGDSVRAGEVVCEVMTDKVDMEVESPVDGVISRILIHDGEVVPVGEPIAFITSEADDLLGDVLAPAASPATSTPETVSDNTRSDVTLAETSQTEAASPAPPVSGQAQSHIPAAVPRARGIAKATGIDLATVRGTGPQGLITVADVEAVRNSTAAPVGDDKRRATVRERVGALMTQSALIPQFTVWRDLDLEDLSAVRAGVSWNTLLLRALAKNLRNSPHLNGTYVRTYVPADTVAVGLAVDSAVGLLAPTVTDADQLDLEELDAELRALVARARTGKLDARYLAPASSALSNLGSLGVERFNAMLTPPHVTALSVGAVGRKPVAHHGGVALRMTATVGLTVDHRAADGADAARFLSDLAELVGNPSRLI